MEDREANAMNLPWFLTLREPPPPCCNEHGTIYAILSDFGDRMTTQSMGILVLLSEYF